MKKFKSHLSLTAQEFLNQHLTKTNRQLSHYLVGRKWKPGKTTGYTRATHRELCEYLGVPDPLKARNWKWLNSRNARLQNKNNTLQFKVWELEERIEKMESGTFNL